MGCNGRASNASMPDGPMVSFDGNQPSFSPSNAKSRDLTVLIVGRLGQGVGLAGDVLAEAAALDGYWLWRREVFKEVGEVMGTGSVLRLASAQPPSPVPGLRIDLLLALDASFGHRCRRLVKPTGTAIFVSGPPSKAHRRLGMPPTVVSRVASAWTDSIASTALAAPIEAIGLLLGHASRDLPLAADSWHAALEAQIPSVRVERCREMFAAGRVQTRRWPNGR